jgi:hypothetical protein
MVSGLNDHHYSHGHVDHGNRSSTTQLYEVTFNESTICYSPSLKQWGYADEWAVTLGNATLSQPSNMSFPFPAGSGGARAAG